MHKFFAKDMDLDCQLFVESSIRGYHAYCRDINVYVGEVMTCEQAPDNEHDEHAVAIKKTGSEELVGHVPIELSKIFCKFLSDSGEIEAECIGSRYSVGEGKGLELPADYRLLSDCQYLKSKKETNLKT